MTARERTLKLLKGNYDSLENLIQEESDFCFSTAKKGEVRKVFFHTQDQNQDREEEDFIFFTTEEYETFLAILENLSCQDMVTVSIGDNLLH